MTKQELDKIMDECYRAVDRAVDRRLTQMERNAGIDMVGEPGNDHGAHETLEGESDVERERR